MQPSLIGVGPALRKARLHRGVSLAEAARDTRIRPDFIRALEEEEFDVLLGDVYVRGALRSYSQYLGLNADKVVGAYARGIGEPEPPRPTPNGQQPALAHRPPKWGLAVLVAAFVLVLAAAFGVLSRSKSTPPPTALEANPAEAHKAAREIHVGLEAIEDVGVTIEADGVRIFDGGMMAGEARSFAAAQSLTVELSHGGHVRVSVNGKSLGRPGTPNRPWRETFRFEERSTPSPTAEP